MKKLFLALLFGFTTQCQADFFSATDAYDQGDFKTAYQQFSEMASIGEKQSQFNLGVMYFQGQHVEKDINRAYAWIKLSTDSDIMNTTHTDVLKKVESLVTNKVEADQIYSSLTEKYSTTNLMKKLYPEIVSTDESAPFSATPFKIKQPKYPKKAALKGIEGWTQLSFDLDKKGTPRNIQLNESMPSGVFSKASLSVIKDWRFIPAKNNHGEPIAQQNLTYTMQFLLGEGGSIELKKGLYEKNLKLAKAGNPNAQFLIGYYEKKLDVSKGEENPNDWFLKAAIQGQPEAQFEIGQSLIHGQGCRLDKTKGIDWLTRAANNGERRAKLLLASTTSKSSNIESQRQSLKYTAKLEELTARVTVDQAWMLITSPFEEISNPKKALKMIDNTSSNAFDDDITIYEIKAAAYAALGDFEEAIDYQEDALEEAEDRNADTDAIIVRLASYKKNEKWF